MLQGRIRCKYIKPLLLPETIYEILHTISTVENTRYIKQKGHIQQRKLKLCATRTPQKPEVNPGALEW
jgi:hypothetical protein